MAKFGSSSVFLLLDGYDLTPHKPKALEYGDDNPVEDDTGLGGDWVTRKPIGVRDSEVSIEGGFYDDDQNSIHDAISGSIPSDPSATPRILCVGVAGETIGQLFDGWEEAFSHGYKVMAEREGMHKANAQYAVSGQHDEGEILQELATKTTDWDTESSSVDHASKPGRIEVPITSNSQANPSVVTTPVPHGLTTGDVIVIAGNSGSSPAINGEQTVTVITTTTFSLDGVDTSAGSGGTGGTFVRASSQNGGAGYLQVTEFSGWDDITVKVRHSADDVSFADLATFTLVSSAPSAERITVAAGTTVNRYLAMDATFGGSGPGSAKVFVGFARAA